MQTRDRIVLTDAEAAIAQRAKEEATAERIRAERALEDARKKMGMLGKEI